MLLQKTLRFNAVFSLLCALSLLGFTEKLASFMGTIPTIYFQFVGIILIGFAILLLFVSERKPMAHFVQIITLMDWGWVVGSALLILFMNSYFTVGGVVIVIVVAFVVGMCAYFQSKSIRNNLKATGK